LTPASSLEVWVASDGLRATVDLELFELVGNFVLPGSELARDYSTRNNSTVT
jgi:hypothetical protein